jgi:hypothetical protein
LHAQTLLAVADRPFDHFPPDPNTQSRIAERTLNAAIVHADISRSYEEYLEIFDEFCADGIAGSSETTEEPIRGKAGVRSLVFGFLVPLHAMAEVGGMSISVRQTSIPGDVVDETHSAWTSALSPKSPRLRRSIPPPARLVRFRFAPRQAA